MSMNKKIFPNYSEINSGEKYSFALDVELIQCKDEGLDISSFERLFSCISALPDDANREKVADILFDYIFNAEMLTDYPYYEPSELSSIISCSNADNIKAIDFKTDKIYEKVAGAWYGRTSGCMLGKTVEGIRTDDFYPFLKKTNNFPMSRYITSSDTKMVNPAEYKFNFKDRYYADQISYLPADDDTNYTVFYQYIIEKFGRDFTSRNIADEWLKNQTKDTYFTAERVAYMNFIKGYYPPESAVYKNPYREWIGAQIRGDYFGYINPGNPVEAAKMAYKDACISHVKNGIYGEMFAAAIISSAAVNDDIITVINDGLNIIPRKSRLHKKLSEVLCDYNNGADYDNFISKLHGEFNEHLSHHWCHTIPNAMIVVAALLYGNKDFGKSICLAVQAGFDTDCNGATVGSVLGYMLGKEAIADKWTSPFNGIIETYILSKNKVNIEDCILQTIKHIELINGFALLP